MGIRDFILASVRDEERNEVNKIPWFKETTTGINTQEFSDSIRKDGIASITNSTDSSTDLSSSFKSSLSSATFPSSYQFAASPTRVERRKRYSPITAATQKNNKSNKSNTFRSMYYRKLGVLASEQGETRRTQNRSRTFSDPLAPTAAAPLEVLKTDGGLHDTSLTLHSPPVSPTKIKAKRTTGGQQLVPAVCFEPQVQVQRVPGRQDLPDSIKDSLWMSMPEFIMGVERNTLEFASEGFAWQNVMEEEQFMFWNGTMVHPASYHAYYAGHAPSPVPPRLRDSCTEHSRCNLKRPFLMYMRAQQQQQQQP